VEPGRRGRTQHHGASRALIVTAVPLAAVAALGGAPTAATFPLLLAAAFAFLINGGSDLLSRDTRWLDAALVAFLAGAVLQFVLLPTDVIAAISPATPRVQSVLLLDVPRPWRSLSIDSTLTRDSVASAASALLVFWAARYAFGRRRLRAAARLVAIAGGAIAVVGLVQQITSPRLLLWTWSLQDPGAHPYGPFVNRNHFATWLLMALALTAGYLVVHLRSHRVSRRSRRLLVHDVLADGTALLLGASAAVMTIALFAAGSRGALAGLAAAIVTALVLSRRAGVSRRALFTAAAIVIAMLGVAAWINADILAGRLIAGTEVSRGTIWRETIPVIRDFPLTGTGLGTYRSAMTVYQQSKSELLFNQAHNEYLQLAAEGGLLLTIPAVVAVLAWLGLAIDRLGSDRRDVAVLRVAALAAMTGVATQCIWDATLRMPANAMLFALLAAVVTHRKSTGDTSD
jgi:putative inorganic carbon (hco3(-)) transporter